MKKTRKIILSILIITVTLVVTYFFYYKEGENSAIQPITEFKIDAKKPYFSATGDSNFISLEDTVIRTLDVKAPTDIDSIRFDSEGPATEHVKSTNNARKKEKNAEIKEREPANKSNQKAVNDGAKDEDYYFSQLKELSKSEFKNAATDLPTKGKARVYGQQTVTTSNRRIKILVEEDFLFETKVIKKGTRIFGFAEGVQAGRMKISLKIAEVDGAEIDVSNLRVFDATDGIEGIYFHAAEDNSLENTTESLTTWGAGSMLDGTLGNLSNAMAQIGAAAHQENKKKKQHLTLSNYHKLILK